MKRYLASFILGAALLSLSPTASFADEHHRYYDSYRHDWHEWNEAEARAYRHWLTEERHEHAYRDYGRLSRERQREYWRWRHEHEGWR